MLIFAFAVKTTHNIPVKEGICDKCGSELILRDDDKAETVLKRLQVYHTQTQPLIDFYENKKVLKSVDGTKKLEMVFEEICTLLD
ncbi:MAG: hypothetical protein HGA25_11515 [Clostridiales bacterium]|nr:hypothetical protein [Clostridiales bacterium]